MNKLIRILPLLVVPLVALAAGPSEKTTPTQTTNIKLSRPDAGADAGTDGGVKTTGIVGPRRQLLAEVALLRINTEKEYGKPVRLQTLLFADNHTDTKDAAIVIFSVGEASQGLFFFLDNGKWKVFPSDFSADP